MEKKEVAPVEGGKKKKNRKPLFITAAVGVVAIVVACLVLFSKCGTDRTADTRELLGSVPSDISYVAVADAEQLMKAEALKNTNLPLDGIDPSMISIFSEGYNTWLTGFLSSSDDFKSAVEKHFNETFTAADIATCGNVAVNGNRFWVLLSSHNTVNADDVKHFLNLSQSQSFLSNSESDNLIEGSGDLRGWGDVKGTLNSIGLEFTKRATATMAIDALFDDAAAFRFNADFDKDQSEFKLSVLNSKGKVAKFLYPMDKIDTKLVEASGFSGDQIAAAGISPKMVERLKEDTKGKGFSVLGFIAPSLSSVSGTAVYCAAGDNATGIISTDGNNTTALTELLQQMDFKVNKEGNQLRFAKGEVKGSVTAADAAADMKGAVAAVVGADADMKEKGITACQILLIPESSGMRLEVKTTSTTPLLNLILTGIKF